MHARIPALHCSRRQNEQNIQWLQLVTSLNLLMDKFFLWEGLCTLRLQCACTSSQCLRTCIISLVSTQRSCSLNTRG
jgi:hypothetical protein